jgi:hypothetical protein
LDQADNTESQAVNDKNKREKKARKDKKKEDNDQKYKVKAGAKTMTYKVKGNASAPLTHEANESGDADMSKENTEGQQYEAYNQKGYKEEEPEDEAETLRRKNSAEESELLIAAV